MPCQDSSTLPTHWKFQDITGQRFGHLTVLSFHERRNSRYYWKCQCDCGCVSFPNAEHLKSGHTTSCGCIGKINQAELYKYVQTHGATSKSHPLHYLYKLWTAIKSRCGNLNNEFYGGRGIKVGPDWINDFPVFADHILTDIGHKPTTKHSLDRIDNNLGYHRGNVKWSTPLEQMANIRKEIHTSICANPLCRTEFTYLSPSHDRKYCTTECYHEHVRVNPRSPSQPGKVLKCPRCGTEKYINASNPKKYCTWECYQLARIGL